MTMGVVRDAALLPVDDPVWFAVVQMRQELRNLYLRISRGYLCQRLANDNFLCIIELLVVRL